MIQPEHFLTASGVLLGFQLTAFSWRVNRELELKELAIKDAGLKRGIAPADWLSLIAILLSVISLLIVLLGLSIGFALSVLSSGLVLSATYPFALLAHYEFFTRKTDQDRNEKAAERDEWIAIIIGANLALLVGLATMCRNMCA